MRGSVPWARRDAVRHGTNTPCIELRGAAGGAQFVLDATGLVGRARPISPRPTRSSGSGCSTTTHGVADAALDRIVEYARAIVPQTFAAAEGMLDV